MTNCDESKLNLGKDALTGGSEDISCCVEEIIEAVDVDGDGIITKQEFIQNAMKSSFISSIISSNGKTEK